MKKKDKKFLKRSDDHSAGQLCYPFERKSAERLLKKGYIKKIEENYPYYTPLNEGEFIIYLSKKGRKRVRKYQEAK
jgi:hypothetical protein